MESRPIAMTCSKPLGMNWPSRFRSGLPHPARWNRPEALNGRGSRHALSLDLPECRIERGRVEQENEMIRGEEGIAPPDLQPLSAHRRHGVCGVAEYAALASVSSSRVALGLAPGDRFASDPGVMAPWSTSRHGERRGGRQAEVAVVGTRHVVLGGRCPRVSRGWCCEPSACASSLEIL